MDQNELIKLQYPIGKYKAPDSISKADVDGWIHTIEEHPAKLRRLVNGLSDEQLNTPYRPGGWTIRQVVHHLPDSHLNSYIRFKWTLTEDIPTIKPYHEDRWAELPDSFAPTDIALNLLDAVHVKWVLVLKSLSKDDLKKTFIHPESGKERFLDWNIGLYAWHCNHHYAHIENLKKEKGW
jgi:DinB superfamily